jgi:hypothetical protein
VDPPHADAPGVLGGGVVVGPQVGTPGWVGPVVGPQTGA